MNLHSMLQQDETNAQQVHYGSRKLHCDGGNELNGDFLFAMQREERKNTTQTKGSPFWKNIRFSPTHEFPGALVVRFSLKTFSRA